VTDVSVEAGETEDRRDIDVTFESSLVDSLLAVVFADVSSLASEELILDSFRFSPFLLSSKNDKDPVSSSSSPTFSFVAGRRPSKRSSRERLLASRSLVEERQLVVVVVELLLLLSLLDDES